MSLDLTVYKVASLSTGDSTKLNNSYDAIQAFVNALPVANIAGYPSDSTKFLRGDGQWVGGFPKVTVSLWSGGPPGSPADGDIWVATAVDTGNLATSNGTRWHFQYNASSGTNKWECIGGTPLIVGYGNLASVINAGTQIGATGFWTAPGLNVTLSRSGDYYFDGAISIYTGASVSGGGVIVQPFSGSALIVGFQTQMFAPSSTNVTISTAADAWLAGMTAGTNVGLAVSTPANGTYQFNYVDVRLMPRRIT